ncbi:hypothetical protein R1sor_000582 [Riccia sorocarpa]|uniref:Uncharacterized protein n=1 Tax=Riccia sorocarpa TaxID=122646 RepID=A0ABD3GTH8_9MARC
MVKKSNSTKNVGIARKTHQISSILLDELLAFVGRLSRRGLESDDGAEDGSKPFSDAMKFNAADEDRKPTPCVGSAADTKDTSRLPSSKPFVNNHAQLSRKGSGSCTGTPSCAVDPLLLDDQSGGSLVERLSRRVRGMKPIGEASRNWGGDYVSAYHPAAKMNYNSVFRQLRKAFENFEEEVVIAAWRENFRSNRKERLAIINHILSENPTEVQPEVHAEEQPLPGELTGSYDRNSQDNPDQSDLHDLSPSSLGGYLTDNWSTLSRTAVRGKKFHLLSDVHVIPCKRTKQPLTEGRTMSDTQDLLPSPSRELTDNLDTLLGTTHGEEKCHKVPDVLSIPCKRTKLPVPAGEAMSNKQEISTFPQFSYSAAQPLRPITSSGNLPTVLKRERKQSKRIQLDNTSSVKKHQRKKRLAATNEILSGIPSEVESDDQVEEKPLSGQLTGFQHRKLQDDHDLSDIQDVSLSPCREPLDLGTSSVIAHGEEKSHQFPDVSSKQTKLSTVKRGTARNTQPLKPIRDSEDLFAILKIDAKPSKWVQLDKIVYVKQHQVNEQLAVTDKILSKIHQKYSLKIQLKSNLYQVALMGLMT